MSEYGTIIRKSQNLQNVLNDLSNQISTFFQDISVQSETMAELLHALRTFDAFLTHIAYLQSINLYLAENGGSRGSYLVEKSHEIFR